MTYARNVKIATLLSLLWATGCTTEVPPVTSVEPNEPAEDPCLGLSVESTPYHDERGEKIQPGGTVKPGGTAGHLLSFEPGRAMREVRVRIVPQAHAGKLPPFLPTLDLRTATEIGDAVVDYVADPFQSRANAADAAVATDYDGPHDLVIQVDLVTERGTSYFVGFGGETGPGALPLRICGTSVTFE